MSENLEIDYAFLASSFPMVDTQSMLTNIESSSLLLFESEPTAATDAGAGSTDDDMLKFNSVILNQDEANSDNYETATANADAGLADQGATMLDAGFVQTKSAEHVYDDLLDDCLFAVLFQVHRAAKLGYLFLNEEEGQAPSPPTAATAADQLSTTTDNNATKDPPACYSDQDVLGFYSNSGGNGGTSKHGHQSNSANNALLKYECACPNCGRTIAATRFAPHLEKCMGMGRSSSRIATRRIANYNGDELDQLIEATGIIYPKEPAATASLHSSLSTPTLLPGTTSSSSAYVNNSSSSSTTATTMLNSYDQYFKQPASKKRRIQPPLAKSATTILPVVQAQTSSNHHPKSISNSSSLLPPSVVMQTTMLSNSSLHVVHSLPTPTSSSASSSSSAHLLNATSNAYGLMETNYNTASIYSNVSAQQSAASSSNN